MAALAVLWGMRVGAAAPAPVLHYTFNEAAGGAVPALDSGTGIAANGTLCRQRYPDHELSFALGIRPGPERWQQ